MQTLAQRLLSTFLDPQIVPVHIASNLVRATIDPAGLRPHIVNFAEVAALVRERVERAHRAHPDDEERRTLLAELRRDPELAAIPTVSPAVSAPFAVLHLRRGDLELRLFALLTTIGTPLDVTAQELTIESLFPADDATEHWFRASWGESDPLSVSYHWESPQSVWLRRLRCRKRSPCAAALRDSDSIHRHQGCPFRVLDDGENICPVSRLSFSPVRLGAVPNSRRLPTVAGSAAELVRRGKA